jgi:phage N-6-adenine-methyltransferase
MSQPVTQPSEYAEVLEDNDINRMTAHRWQVVATVPDEVFEEHVATVQQEQRELTSAGLLRLAGEIKQAAETIAPQWKEDELRRREFVEAGVTVHANMKTDLALIQWADDNDESLTDDDMQVMQPEPSRPHVSFNSGNNEWYTPAEYIEAAREVMGRIDLDPASSDIANQTIRAVTYYTAEDDGLSHHWRGNVWMNPPYAGELIGKFASKLIYHVTECDVRQAIILVNNATETTWFQEMIDEATAVVFPRSRVRFWKPDGTLGAPLQGQAIIYIGQHADAFLSEFSRFGWGANVYEL